MQGTDYLVLLAFAAIAALVSYGARALTATPEHGIGLLVGLCAALIAAVALVVLVIRSQRAPRAWRSPTMGRDPFRTLV